MDLIYKDKEFTLPLNKSFLWEGKKYYLDLRGFTEEQRQKIVDDARLNVFMQFDRRNPVCSFVITGFVGIIKLHNQQYDVRSKKFNIFYSGDIQFETLLADIERIQRGLLFRYESPSYSEMEETITGVPPSNLERLHFFRTNMEGSDLASSIQGIMYRIFSKPHHTIQSVNKKTRIEAARRVDASTFSQDLVKGNLVFIREESKTAKPRGAIQTTKGMYALPHYVSTKSNCLDYDTVENRFLKFFLEDIQSVCLSVMREKNINNFIYLDAEALLHRTRELLGVELFKNVGKLQYLPTYSPVLEGNEAYNRIYSLYIRSRLGLRDPLTAARNQLRQSPLKDIATLYEIWVFFKVVEAFFISGSLLTVTSAQSGGLCYGTTWCAEDISITYNRTISKKNGSYSLYLRPDIIVQKGNRSYIFDAKYKAELSELMENVDELSSTACVKKEDLHKMHTYVDAIDHVRTAVVVYPGLELSLYVRDVNVEVSFVHLLQYGGIGGIPLLPLSANPILEDVAAAIRSIN